MSRSLTKTGDFYGLENLEELYLIDCVNLKELHASIGCLHKLAILDLHSSIPLKRIPWEMIGKLQSLRELKLGKTFDIVLKPDEHINPNFQSSCKEYSIIKRSLPDSLLQFHVLKRIELVDYVNIRSIPNLPQNITYIKAYGCASLVNLPLNISELKSLTVLDFHLCPKLGSEDPQFLMKVTGLTELSHLSMSGCGVSQVPGEIGNLVSLKKLDLSVNTFSTLPNSLSRLTQLVDLNVDYCSQLRLLPILPSNLINVGVYGCHSLDLNSSATSGTKVCKETPFSKGLVIRLSGDWFPDWCNCRNRGDVLSFVSPLHLDKSFSLWGKQVHDWCDYRNGGDVISFVAPLHLDRKIRGMILCATTRKGPMKHTISIKMINKTKNTSHHLKEMVLDLDCSMGAMFYPLDDTTLVVEAGDTVVLEFPRESVSSCGLRLCCGLRLIYESDMVDPKLVHNSKSTYTLGDYL